MRHIQVEYCGVKEAVIENYYDFFASYEGSFCFLSPIIWPKWLSSAVDWMCSSTTVGELGCGRGEFAEQCILKKDGAIRTYHLFDISEGMLNRAQARLAKHPPSVDIHCAKADFSRDLPEMGDKQIEKIIAINVFQDVNPKQALRNLHQLLRPGGQLRATFLWREALDLVFADDDNYDMSAGRLYAYSQLHQKAGIPPLGHVLVSSQHKPFYRVQQYFTQDDVLKLLEETKFALRSISKVIFPKDVIEQYIATGPQRISLTAKQKKLMEEWDGVPDALDIIADRL
jgi:ubiquinone/menaquinone biosynthesis C-methylase UbiE